MFTWPKLIKKPIGKNVLILSPHMDDEIIGCGGVICKHVKKHDKVSVIYFTAGDKGNKSFASDDGLSQQRKEEIKKANKVLGIQKSYFFDFPDGTDDDWDRKAGYLREIYLQVLPELVYLPPFYDLHLDHRKTNWLFQQAVSDLEICKLCVYEVWTPVNPNIIVNITQEMDKKIAAISECKTQIKSVDYISMIKNLNSYRSLFAMSPIVEFAECFYMTDAKEYFSKFKKNEFDWHSSNL